MQRSALAKVAYAAAVALALGFGAREVAAAPAAAQAPPYCEDDFHCQQTCDRKYGVGKTIGVCSNNTCSCL